MRKRSFGGKKTGIPTVFVVCMPEGERRRVRKKTLVVGVRYMAMASRAENTHKVGCFLN